MLLLLAPVSTMQSCKTSNTSSKERQIQREKKKRQKNDTVLYQKALKQHAKSQTKNTRKAMRDSYRKAQNYNNNQREFFLTRWMHNWFKYKPEQNNKG